MQGYSFKESPLGLEAAHKGRQARPAGLAALLFMEGALIRGILRGAAVEPQPRPYTAVIAALERALDKVAAFADTASDRKASISAVDEECTLRIRVLSTASRRRTLSPQELAP